MILVSNDSKIIQLMFAGKRVYRLMYMDNMIFNTYVKPVQQTQWITQAGSATDENILSNTEWNVQ